MKTICKHDYPSDLCGICNPIENDNEGRNLADDMRRDQAGRERAGLGVFEKMAAENTRMREALKYIKTDNFANAADMRWRAARALEALSDYAGVLAQPTPIQDGTSLPLPRTCSAQLISDWTDASIITIDGIDFAPVGYDGECGFSDEDLDNGLQLRIWEAVHLIASAFGGEVLDCRPNAGHLAPPLGHPENHE